MIDMAMARSLDCTFECFFCVTKHFFQIVIFLRIYQVATFFQSSYSFYLKVETWTSCLHSLILDLTPSSACSALESLLQGKSKEFLRNILRYSAYWEQSFWAESWLIPMLLPEDGRRGRKRAQRCLSELTSFQMISTREGMPARHTRLTALSIITNINKPHRVSRYVMSNYDETL